MICDLIKLKVETVFYMQQGKKKDSKAENHTMKQNKKLCLNLKDVSTLLI